MALKIIADMSDYQPWSGAVNHYNELDDKGLLDDFESLMEDCYPDGLEMVQLNDILWFEWDWICESLGIKEDEEDEDE